MWEYGDIQREFILAIRSYANAMDNFYLTHKLDGPLTNEKKKMRGAYKEIKRCYDNVWGLNLDIGLNEASVNI